jgi:hypothetical protein
LPGFRTQLDDLQAGADKRLSNVRRKRIDIAAVNQEPSGDRAA